MHGYSQLHVGLNIPYGGKLWRVETLADLANDHKFAKVSSAKILCSILNYIINVQICQSLFCHLYFCSEFAKVCTHQSFPLYGSSLHVQCSGACLKDKLCGPYRTMINTDLLKESTTSL